MPSSSADVRMLEDFTSLAVAVVRRLRGSFALHWIRFAQEMHNSIIYLLPFHSKLKSMLEMS
jgi:hypothetical protein